MGGEKCSLKKTLLEDLGSSPWTVYLLGGLYFSNGFVSIIIYFENNFSFMFIANRLSIYSLYVVLGITKLFYLRIVKSIKFFFYEFSQDIKFFLILLCERSTYFGGNRDISVYFYRTNKTHMRKIFAPTYYLSFCQEVNFKDRDMPIRK